MEKVEHNNGNVKEERYMGEDDVIAFIVSTLIITSIIGKLLWNTGWEVFKSIYGMGMIGIELIFFLVGCYCIHLYIKCKREDSFYKNDKNKKLNAIVEQ